MTETQSRTVVRRHRSRAEAEQVAAEFSASGLRRHEFAQQHGIALNTLNRYISRYSDKQPAARPQLLRVEVREPVGTGSGIAVMLGSGRRVELAKDFDAATLAEAVRVLERL
jgi:hypothetical protein